MLCLQHTEIKRSFGNSLIQVSKDFKGSLYSDLVGRVSLQALQLIKVEEDKYRKTKLVVGEHCPHTSRSTLGLPCSHELAPYIAQNKACPIWLVHKHWKQLSFPLDSDKMPNVQESMPTKDVERRELTTTTLLTMESISYTIGNFMGMHAKFKKMKYFRRYISCWCRKCSFSPFLRSI